ncbi:hypothetical protein KI387_038719 [Taxus chinensis]|uniref:SUN domain-containing protein n=1 Tax=Taxus chinensis TaxID=29808 RepID=A0AA38C5S1_TAXCH|nr:hypothetical protein KI387_038719 [Taxus chinensis]
MRTSSLWRFASFRKSDTCEAIPCCVDSELTSQIGHFQPPTKFLWQMTWPKSVAYDRSSAPKDFRVFGWLSQYKDDTNVEPEKMFPLGEFSYDLERGSAQTFNLPDKSTGKVINMIKLHVLSNHGSPSHTCIYRLRVHGSEPESPMSIANEA